MLRVSERVYFYDAEGIAAKLAEAMRVVGEAEIETGLRGKALELVFNRLTEQQVVVEQISPAGVVLGGTPNGPGLGGV